MFIQFVIFPRAARRYGVLQCLKVVAIIAPILYFLTPFTALVPEKLQYVTMFVLMQSKLALSIFGFPCCTILLTNTASSMQILGTLNGVGVSISAIGRTVGPAIVGAAFTRGVKMGYVIVPWWVLTFLSALSAVPVFWIRETEGFVPKDEEDDEDSEETVVEGSRSPDSTASR